MPNKEKLQRDLATLRKREANLEQSIKELPDEAEAGYVDFFNDQLRLTQAKAKVIEKQMAEIVADEQKASAEAERTAHDDLIKLYKDSTPSEFREMNPVLKERVLAAVQKEGERALFGS